MARLDRVSSGTIYRRNRSAHERTLTRADVPFATHPAQDQRASIHSRASIRFLRASALDSGRRACRDKWIETCEPRAWRATTVARSTPGEQTGRVTRWLSVSSCLPA